MSALTTRQQARARLEVMFKSALDRFIPHDELASLRGTKFIDFEEYATQCFNDVIAAAIEERAKVDGFAWSTEDQAGRCPACGYETVYLRKETGQQEYISPHGPVVLKVQHARCRRCDLSFTLQEREWQLPSEAHLTPKALRRVAREAATQSFDKVAVAINEDWELSLDGKQIQRWAGRLGERLCRERDQEQAAFEAGKLNAERHKTPVLLSVQIDGGRVQTCEINPESGSRWREDKVAAITTYLPGNSQDRPEPLVTTHVATMQPAEPFGRLVRTEAEKRGIAYAQQTVLIGDGGNWLDPLFEREFPGCPRIVDWYHAVEHLYDCARALHGSESAETTALAETLKSLLWAGQLPGLLEQLRQVRDAIVSQEKRAVLECNLGYFERHAKHMDYPTYRQRGWPIGSGCVESAVKQFNKRVKGTEQFWQENGAEAILALRALWLSQDERWKTYWRRRPAYALN